MNIVDPIQEHAKKTPAEAALILPDGRVTWAQLDTLLWRSAHLFSSQNIEAGDLVGLAFEHPLLHLVAALGLAKIGAIQVVLPLSEPPSVRKKISAYLGMSTVVTDRPTADFFGLPVVALTSFPAQQGSPTLTKRTYPVTSEQSWMLISSSGTTSEPKYAELSHKVSLERFARWSDAYEYRKGDVFWINIDVNTITGKQHMISALQAGVSICIPAGFKTNSEIVKFVNECDTTIAYGIPSFLWSLTKISNGSPILPNIRRFFSGTTEISDQLFSEFTKKVCPNFYTNYGTNEAPCATVSSPLLRLQENMTVGTPHKLLELQIVDSDGVVLDHGITGKIRLRGQGIVSQYYRNPVATKKAFKDGWFYPGDLAYISASGAVTLQGRADEIMIYDGVNIFPHEIEQVLCEHSFIKDAIAFSLDHALFKDEPAVAVILKSELNEQDLIEWAKIHLGFKHPRRIFFVNEFPKTPNGKIMRRELSRLHSPTA